MSQRKFEPNLALVSSDPDAMDIYSNKLLLQYMIEVPESYCLIQLRCVRMLVQPLSLLMSCSERSIWLEAQPTVAAQHYACHYPVSTANTTLHLHLSLYNSSICTD